MIVKKVTFLTRFVDKDHQSQIFMVSKTVITGAYEPPKVISIII